MIRLKEKETTAFGACNVSDLWGIACHVSSLHGLCDHDWHIGHRMAIFRHFDIFIWHGIRCWCLMIRPEGREEKQTAFDAIHPLGVLNLWRISFQSPSQNKSKKTGIFCKVNEDLEIMNGTCIPYFLYHWPWHFMEFVLIQRCTTLGLTRLRQYNGCSLVLQCVLQNRYHLLQFYE